MDVCGSERVSSHCREQLTGRAVIWNWIADRDDRSESIATRRIGPKACSQVTLWLILVLNVIQLIGCSLPNLYQRAGNGLPLGVRDTPTHHQRFARLLPK